MTDEDEEYSGPEVKLVGDLTGDIQFEIKADTAVEVLTEYAKLEEYFKDKK